MRIIKVRAAVSGVLLSLPLSYLLTGTKISLLLSLLAVLQVCIIEVRAAVSFVDIQVPPVYFTNIYIYIYPVC